MKRLRLYVCLAVIAISLVFPGAAFASDGRVPLYDDQVVLGGTYTLDAGDELDGSLIVIGGVVKLEPESTVQGDVLVFGGNVTVEGRVRQNLVAVGGVVVLTENAEIFGDLIAPATVVRRDAGAQVYGQVIADTEGLDIEMPEIPDVPDVPELPEVREPDFFDTYVDSVSRVLRPITDFIGALIGSFALAAVAVLVRMVMPRHTEKVSDVVQNQPVSAGGLGILTGILAVPVMVITTITIILIPATLVIAVALVIGLFFGLVAVGTEIGRRMAEGLNVTWKRPLQTAIGNFAIVFLISIFNLAHWDWLATLLWIILGGIGLGAVMMTRFGTRVYQGTAAQTAPAGGPDTFENQQDELEAHADSAVEDSGDIDTAAEDLDLPDAED